MNSGMTARRPFFCLQNIASMLDLQLKPHTNEQKLICDQLSDSSTMTPKKRVSVFLSIDVCEILMGKEGLLYS